MTPTEPRVSCRVGQHGTGYNCWEAYREDMEEHAPHVVAMALVAVVVRVRMVVQIRGVVVLVMVRREVLVDAEAIAGRQRRGRDVVVFDAV